MKKQQGVSLLAVLVILLAGMILTAGAGFTLNATDQAEFCGSCHVMYESVRTHQQSVHARLSCNECHAPYTALPKMVFKTYAGTKDVYRNIAGDIPDVINVTDRSRDIIKDNCINCHTMTGLNVAAREVKPYCTDCHRQIPHMSKLSIAQRRVADE